MGDHTTPTQDKHRFSIFTLVYKNIYYKILQSSSALPFRILGKATKVNKRSHLANYTLQSVILYRAAPGSSSVALTPISSQTIDITKSKEPIGPVFRFYLSSGGP